MRAALLAPLLVALASPVMAETVTQRSITVTGAAEAQAVPDRASVTAGVETRGATAAAALAANAETMTAVFDALEAAGIPRAQVQTNQFTLNPVFEPFQENAEAPPAVIAYDASNVVTVRLTALDTLGKVIDALAAAGANRFDGVSFDVADPATALNTAREKAVADAQARAALYAQAAGVKLGSVLTITEQTGVSGPIMLRAMAADAPSTPIAPGTVSLSAEVQVVYGIE